MLGLLIVALFAGFMAGLNPPPPIPIRRADSDSSPNRNRRGGHAIRHEASKQCPNNTQ